MDKLEFDVEAISAPLIRKDGRAVVLVLHHADNEITLKVPTEMIGDVAEQLDKLYAAAKVQSILPTQDPHPDRSYRPTPEVHVVDAAALIYHDDDLSVSLQIRTADRKDLLVVFDAEVFQQISETAERHRTNENPSEIN
jgi:hypothetical protein